MNRAEIRQPDVTSSVILVVDGWRVDESHHQVVGVLQSPLVLGNKILHLVTTSCAGLVGEDVFHMCRTDAPGQSDLNRHR